MVCLPLTFDPTPSSSKDQFSREKRMNKKYGAGTPPLRSYREREKVHKGVKTIP